jgi:group II intron reverse transcriptase/maturase
MIDYYETKSQPITRVMVWQAYKKIKANRGSAGIDQMSWKDLDNNLSEQLYMLWNRLTSGSYFPMPVKEVAIEKKSGGVRMLGIPTILDRIAQEVVKTHLERIVEPQFHNSSFGYRPGKSCHQAVKQAEQHSFRHNWVIDLDIKRFFDTIDQKLLMKTVQHYCKDEWVLMYVERWLQAGIVKKDGSYVNRVTGTPQGGVISPLLANMFLHVVFDKWMEKEFPNKPFERYADDIIVHCKTDKQAKFVLSQIRRRFKQCNLELHPVKTKIVNFRGITQEKYPQSFDFLGFTFRPYWCKSGGKLQLMPTTFMSAKSKSSVLEKFTSMQLHKWRKPIEVIAATLNPIITGVVNYYGKFWKEHMRSVWMQLNERLLKWVRWEKGLYRKSALQWIKKKYAESPRLFRHWLLVHP